MKKLFLFSTKLYNFWTVLPLAVLLAVSIHLNGNATGLMKLYPLIILSAAGIVFVILFFLRGIVLSYDDARCVGIFSKKDRARFEKDYSLVITELRHGRLLVEVFGFVEEGGIGYDWYDVTDVAEINLLRARTNGNVKVMKKILRYYGLLENDIDTAMNNGDFKAETRDARFVSTITDGMRQIRITFKELYAADEQPQTKSEDSGLQQQ